MNFFLKKRLTTLFFGIILSQILSFDTHSKDQPKNLGFFLESYNISGWDEFRWGKTLKKTLDLFENPNVITYPEFQIGDCFFSHAIAVKLENEKWQIWLCEGRKNGGINEIAIERGYNGIYFDIIESQTKLFSNFLSTLTKIYGPAHKYWKQCHNSRWHQTEQYSWYFPSTHVSLVHRDVPRKHAAIRFQAPKFSKKYGPGICSMEPYDLRLNVKPEKQIN